MKIQPEEEDLRPEGRGSPRRGYRQDKQETRVVRRSPLPAAGCWWWIYPTAVTASGDGRSTHTRGVHPLLCTRAGICSIHVQAESVELKQASGQQAGTRRCAETRTNRSRERSTNSVSPKPGRFLPSDRWMAHLRAFGPKGDGRCPAPPGSAPSHIPVRLLSGCAVSLSDSLRTQDRCRQSRRITSRDLMTLDK